MIRITALLTGLSFLMPYLGFAFTPANYSAGSPVAYGYSHISANGKEVIIPLELGDITSSFKGQKPLTVVCLQDLHCDYEVQENIAGIIRRLTRKNQLKLIGVEGASQAVDVSKLSTIPVAAIRTQVGQYFLRRGLISGAEYQTALSRRPLSLVGLEEKTLYDQSKQLLNRFLNSQTMGYCEDLRGALEDLRTRQQGGMQPQLDHYKHILDIMEHLLNISVSPEELDYFFSHRGEFKLEKIMKFIHSADEASQMSPFMLDDAFALDQSIKAAETFYGKVNQRSDVFVPNLLRLMAQKQTSLAVMVTGGFHTPHIEALLRKQGVSFVTVKPRLTKTNITNPYFSLLRGQKSPLERLLLKKDGFFALWIRFGTSLFEDHMQFIVDVAMHYEAYLSGNYRTRNEQEQFCADFKKRYSAGGLDYYFDDQPFRANQNKTALAFRMRIDYSPYVAVISNAKRFRPQAVNRKILKDSIDGQIGLRIFAPSQIGVAADGLTIVDQALFDRVLNQEARLSIRDMANWMMAWVGKAFRQINISRLATETGLFLRRSAPVMVTVLVTVGAAALLAAVFMAGGGVETAAETVRHLAAAGGTAADPAAIITTMKSVRIPNFTNILLAGGFGVVGMMSGFKSLEEPPFEAALEKSTEKGLTITVKNKKNDKPQIIEIKKYVGACYQARLKNMHEGQREAFKLFHEPLSYFFGMGGIDSFEAYQKIYGEKAARFFYEVTLHVFKEKCVKGMIDIYRLGPDQGTFGVGIKQVNDAQVVNKLQELQMEVHNELRRTIKIITLGQANDYPDSALREINNFLYANRILGFVFREANQAHLMINENQLNEYHTQLLDLINGQLDKNGRTEARLQSLRNLTFDIPGLRDYNQSYVGDPKLTIALTGRTNAEIIQPEHRKSLFDLILGKQNDAFMAARRRVRATFAHYRVTNGGEIILLPEAKASALAEEEVQVHEFKEAYLGTRTGAAFHLYQRYVRLFEKWFSRTTQ